MSLRKSHQDSSNLSTEIENHLFSLRQQVLNAEEQLKLAEERRTELQARVQTLENEVKTSKKPSGQLDELETQKKKLDDILIEIKALQIERDMLQKEINSVTNENKVLEKFERKSTVFDKLNRGTKAVEQENVELRNQVAVANAEIEALKKELVKMRNRPFIKFRCTIL